MEKNKTAQYEAEQKERCAAFMLEMIKKYGAEVKEENEKKVA